MRTPEEIKTWLEALTPGHEAELNKLLETSPVIGGVTEDALAYIKRLEAELIATRVQLAKDGDLCRICKAQHAEDCIGDCIGCDNVDCCCKRCIDTDGKEGFEWDGGANDDV